MSQLGHPTAVGVHPLIERLIQDSNLVSVCIIEHDSILSNKRHGVGFFERGSILFDKRHGV